MATKHFESIYEVVGFISALMTCETLKAHAEKYATDLTDPASLQSFREYYDEEIGSCEPSRHAEIKACQSALKDLVDTIERGTPSEADKKAVEKAFKEAFKARDEAVTHITSVEILPTHITTYLFPNLK